VHRRFAKFQFSFRFAFCHFQSEICNLKSRKGQGRVTFSPEVIRELLAGSTEQRLAWQEASAQLPATRCRRRTHCCSLLPEMNLVEALTAVQLLVDMVPGQRRQLSRRMIHYFFLNPVEILMCPFLEGQKCLVYQDRFLGCRAYGLWSKGYYQQQAEHSRKAKRLSREQWQRLGVSLPQEVVDFHLPYCPYVELEGDVSVDDEKLSRTSDMIEAISGQLAPWHNSFRQGYFSDLSFLLVSAVLGSRVAIQLKFEMVRDFLSTGKHQKVEGIADKLDDFFEDLKNR
jgi:Fe-S-cluster containining protein